MEVIEESFEENSPTLEGNLKQCAIDYLSRFDVIEIIKVYDFFEIYNLSYDLYDDAVNEFQILSDAKILCTRIRLAKNCKFFYYFIYKILHSITFSLQNQKSDLSKTLK